MSLETALNPASPDNALTPYARAFQRHRMLVALTTLLALLGAGAWLSVRHRDYQASALILVTPLPQADDALIGLPLVRDSGDPTRTVQTVASLLSSPTAAAGAAQRLGAGFTKAGVTEAVQVKPKGESNIVAVTATARQPGEASRIANAYARAALAGRSAILRRQVGFALAQVKARRAAVGPGDVELASDLASRQDQLQTLANGNDPTLQLTAPATPPTTPNGAPSWLIVLLAIVAGAAVGLGTALALELMDRSVRDESDLDAVLGVPVLARVPFLSRRVLRGHRGAVAAPGVREAYRTMKIQLDQLPSGARAVMVTSATKGDGKTSSAINLAAALLGGGSRVILLDFDLRKPEVATRLGIAGERDLLTLLSGTAQLEDVLVSPPELPAMRVALTDPAGTDSILLEALARQLPSILAEAAELADYVVIDTPPLGEVGDALRLLPHVDEVVVVARLGHTDRRSLERARDLLVRAGRTPAGVVVIGAASESRGYYAYGPPSQGAGLRRLARSAR